jgi:hypothetical protein
MDIGVLMDDNFVTNVHLVYQDNQSTIALVKTSSKANSRSKYMKVRQEYVRERLGTSELEIEFLRTSEMLADILINRSVDNISIRWRIRYLVDIALFVQATGVQRIISPIVTTNDL